MASLCALRLSRLQLQPGPRSRVAPAPAPAPHYRRTAAPRPPVGCSSSASQQASGASSQPPERLHQQQQQQQQQSTAGSSSSARVATGSGLVELRFVSSSPATAESEASSVQPQAGGKALFADRVLLWHASPSFARCIDEAMGNDSSGGASKQIVIPMPASEEAAVWEPVLRLLRQEDLLPVNWANLPDLLRVAHTYDMAAVRSACVLFISLHVSQVSLRDAPLESAQNVLHLASLANRYLHMEIVLPTSGSSGGGGTGVSSSSSKGGASAAFRASSTASAAAGTHCVGLEPQLLPLVACIPAAMQTALAPLQITSYYSSSPNHWLPVVDRLTEISRHREYNAIVTEPVRAALLAALLAGVKGETPFIINQ